VLNLKCTDLDVDVTNDKTEDIGRDKTVNIIEDQSVTIGGSKTEDVTGIKTVSAASETITIDTTQLTTCGTSFTVTIGVSPMIVTDGTNILLGDSVIGSLRKIIDERFITLFNNHVHDDVTNGPDTSGTPTVAATIGSYGTDVLRAK
jgi:hypothetical protein